MLTVTVTATDLRENAHPFAAGRLTFGLDGRGGLLILRADPRIILHTQIISLMLRDPGAGVALDDDLLRIRGRDRTVLYRLSGYLPELRAWTAEWPD